MLDPLTSLAFSMHSNPGVYALLLGSGVSRSANIPTGWDITLDLVRKVAPNDGEVDLPVSGAETWYRDKFKEAPDYARLLDRLAKTQAERQQVLKAYIEPTPAERELGQKLPTPAHRAIGRLVAAGKIRVIITTNFDRLLEVALLEEGVVPTIIDTVDAAHGAVPLVHSPCTVIKIHGDYMDARIRNTPIELDHYEAVFDQLLARVFDEFGLIVCGWSAEWDVALRSAIERTPSRRYSMYWAAHGAPGDAAQRLINQRGMSQIAIAGADELFLDLQARVAALDEFNAPHPLSADIALSLLRKYLPEERHRIALDTLVRGECGRLHKAIDEAGFDIISHDVGDNRFKSDVGRYETLSSALVTLAMEAGRWCRGDQVRPWIDAVRGLARRASNYGGSIHLRELQRWPAALLMYAYGVGAMAQNRFPEVGAVVGCVVEDIPSPLCAGDRLNAAAIFTAGQELAGYWNAAASGPFAVSERLHAVLSEVSKRVLRDDIAFDRAFTAFELVLAFGLAERRRIPAQNAGTTLNFWAPPGRYCDRSCGPLRRELIDAWRENPKPVQAAANLKGDPLFSELAVFAGSF